MTGYREFHFPAPQRSALERNFPSEVAQRIISHAVLHASIGSEGRLTPGQIRSEVEKLEKIVPALRDMLLNLADGVDDTIATVAYLAGTPRIVEELIGQLRQFESVLGRAWQLSEPQNGRPSGSSAIALVLEIARELEAIHVPTNASSNGSLCLASSIVFEALGEKIDVTKLVARAMDMREKRLS